MTWLDLASASLLLCILWNLLQLYGAFSPLPVLIATILSPSLIVFREQPDISEFQVRLYTAGNSVRTGCSCVILFSNSDELPLLNCGSGEVQCFQQRTGSWRVMVVWGITKMKVKWLSSTKAQLGLETGCSLKICLFRESSPESDVVFKCSLSGQGFIYKSDLWSISI